MLNFDFRNDLNRRGAQARLEIGHLLVFLTLTSVHLVELLGRLRGPSVDKVVALSCLSLHDSAIRIRLEAVELMTLRVSTEHLIIVFLGIFLVDLLG